VFGSDKVRHIVTSCPAEIGLGHAEPNVFLQPLAASKPQYNDKKLTIAPT
jgi:hypothetical protein